MGWFGNIAGRVRTWFDRDETIAARQHARGSTNDRFPVQQRDLLFGLGQGLLSDWVTVDRDLTARYTDYEDMDEYAEIACLSRDSRVGILGKGRHGVEYVTIADLLERRKLYPEVALYTLALDVPNRKIVPVEFKGPILSGTQQPVFKVTFQQYRADKGCEKKQFSIRATANHPFMLRDGSYRTVADLKAGDRLMPVMSRISTAGYPQVGDLFETANGQTIWSNLHKLVAQTLLPDPASPKAIVHHVDEDKGNCAPGNLEFTSRSNHTRTHAATKRPEVRARISAASKKRWEDPKKAAAWAASQRKRGAPSVLENNNPKPVGILSDSHRAAIAAGHTIPLAPDVVESALRTSTSVAAAARKLNVSWNTLERRRMQYGLDAAIIGSSIQTISEGQVSYENHVVVSVEPDGFDDVYDIEVPIYKNFIAEGVFVHNTAIDIFADDATQVDSVTNRTMWVTSSDKRIQEILDDELLQQRLIIDEEIWEIARTLVKYGNDFEEVLLGPDGVVGFNFLPPSTVRRVEDAKGTLIGFLQDFKERFHMTPQEFETMLKKQSKGNTKAKDDPNDPAYAMAALEPWEVVHFRLRSKYRRSVYGFCLTGDSRVWTPLGVKRLDEVQPGDEVYTRHAGMLRTTKVLDHVCSDTKPVFRLKTTHREIRLTAEHPMLVDRGGKNNAWVPVAELHVGDKLVAVSSQPETLGPVPLGISLRELREDSRVRLTSDGIEALKTRNRPGTYAPTSWGLRPVARSVGISKGMLDELLGRRSSLPLDQVRALFRGVGVPLFDGAFQVVEDSRLRLPDFVDLEFARLFGLLLGDGWIHGNQVCFALKLKEDHNRFYEATFETYGLETGRSKDADEVDRTSYVTCQKLVEVFADLGWAGEKAHDKRVPSWIYAQAPDIREAFLRGFLDAEGWETDNGYEHTELCNEALVRDLKMLIDGLGLTCGNVRRREARTAELKSGKQIHSGPQFTISFRKVPLTDGDFASERVESIEPDGEDLVYDIAVADRSHCFVADGLVVHNSVLEPARWIWKRLTILEDSAILFRLTKAVERFAFYIDVGDMPPAEAQAYVNRVRQQYRKKKYVNPTTGKLELRFDALCLHGDTEVPLLGGTVRTVRAMAEAYARGEDQWVWSVDLDDAGRLRPGKVQWAGQTRASAQLVRVVLDNGEHVIVTPDHKMIRRDGTKVQAQELRPGDSLMPFRRRVSTKVRGDQLEGYELVYCPKTHKSVYGHRVVAEDLGLKASGQLIHHVDLDPLNNAPWNLFGMFYRDHLELHRQWGFNGGEALKRCRAEDPELDRRCRDASSRNIVQYNQRESKREFQAEWNKGRDQGRFIREYNASDRHAEDNVIRSKAMQEMWSDPERRQQACKNMRVKFPTSFVEGVKALVRQNPEATADEIAEAAFDTLRDILQEVNTRKIVSVHRHMLFKMAKEEGYENFDGFRRAAIRDNAEVVSVDWLETPADTFTLTVGETHTFALQAGIFVCNSQDEDFFVPSRGGQDGTRIDVVGAPQWQHMDDIEYFRDKMFSSVKVPKSYLGHEQGVARAVLSSEDVRFARTVLRVQRELKNGMRKVCRIHLMAKNINPATVAFEIRMTVPSAIFELAQLEVRNARADLAARMNDFVSLHWILKNVFSLPDEDIDIVVRERGEDAVRAAVAQGKGEAEAQKLIAQSMPQEAPGQPGQPGGAGEAFDARMASMMERVREQAKSRGYGSGGISRQELHSGDRLAERKAADKLDDILRTDREMAARLDDVSRLLRDVCSAVRSEKAR